MVERAGVNRALWHACWLGCGLAISGFSARAEAPPPSAEFWTYLLEFGDASGEVFDPNDLAMARQVQVKNAVTKNDTSGQPNEANAVEQQRENYPASVPVAPGEKSE